jgi:broad specificity phosphatase PhoE
MYQKISLIRHGQTPLNKAKRYCGSSDPYLTSEGIQMITKLKKYFRHYQKSNIYVSPLKRAVQTAQLIFGKQKQLVLVPDMQELDFGRWEGLTLKEIIRQYPKEARSWFNEPMKMRMPGGESIGQLKHRVMKFFDGLLVHAQQYRNIVLVTHSGPIRVIMSELFRLGPKGYWLVNPTQGSFSELVFKNGQLTEYQLYE